MRTHLENIYARLQVSNRTAAVIRAFPDRVAWKPLDRLGMATATQEVLHAAQGFARL